MNERPPLRPYQEAGVKFLRANPSAFLADEPGLGKTRQLIEASEGDTLVVAPAMVLDGGTWDDEIAKWADDPSRFTTAPYSLLNARRTVDKRRVKKGPDKKPLRDGAGKPVMETYQASEILPTVARQEYRRKWDTVILDEAHYVKNHQANWSRVLKKICRNARRVYLATGTPMSNFAPELFGPLQLLHAEESKPGGRLGSYWKWAEQWFDTTPETIYVRGKEKEVSNVGKMLGCTNLCAMLPAFDPCDHYREFFKANLGDVLLQRLRDDVLSDLPPLTTVQVETPMTARQKKAYAEMKKEYLAQDLDGGLAVAWSASARHVMLDKISTSLGLLGPNFSVAESGKLDRLRFDLENRSRPTLVVAHYKKTVEACEWVARDLGAKAAHIHGATSRADRLARVRAFQAGDLDVLVGSLETISEGLTLTAADMVIFVEHSYKPSRNTQAVRRIHRLGQTRPCTMLDYVTPGTIDERKRALLEAKLDHQMRVLTWAQMKELV